MANLQQPFRQNGSHDPPQVTNPPPQFFGENGTQASPTLANFDFNDGQETQDQDGGHDENDPKRRRIARVCACSIAKARTTVLTFMVGLRYVPKEEDKVRWENASMLSLHKLQDRVHLHPGRKET